MADQVTCPLCGLHPVSDDYCPTLLTEIPPSLFSADSEESSPDEPPHDDSARRHGHDLRPDRGRPLALIHNSEPTRR